MDTKRIITILVLIIATIILFTFFPQFRINHGEAYAAMSFKTFKSSYVSPTTTAQFIERASSTKHIYGN